MIQNRGYNGSKRILNAKTAALDALEVGALEFDF